MAENNGAAPKTAPPPRPTIALPPRSSVENLFLRGADASPGPMTLVSSFFSENDPESECRSFSQLLAGAMASPGAFPARLPYFSGDSSSEVSFEERDYSVGDGRGLRFKQNRPLNLVIAHSPMFTVPPGISPASLLDSPGFLSPRQGPFGMSHQQALAQVTAQAVQSQAYIQAVYPPPLPTATISASSVSSIPVQQTQLEISNSRTNTLGLSDVPQSTQRSQPTAPTVDKPTAPTVDKPSDDGYNWRKYGQKQVKGSAFPRSYYKCTHLNCPVKKKVERSIDGHVTEIIYKGQHNHQKPHPSKNSKESASLSSGVSDMNGNMYSLVNPEMGSVGSTGNFSRSSEIMTVPSSRQDQESAHATTEQISGSSDGEEAGDAETKADEKDDDEPNPKRRNLEQSVTETRIIGSGGSQKTVTEPRIIVQTTSEVDLLDDGYRWRKYGQKVVKGNPHPRSYYKCTHVWCNVRKHVERASTDPKAVITTYEGKHNHEVPAAKHSSHNTASSTQQSKPQNPSENKKASLNKGKLGQPISFVQLKEENNIT